MKKTMNFLPWIVFPGLVFTLVMVLALTMTCKNPGDDNPDGDTLLWSPAPPQLIAPADSYNFMTEASNLYYILRWETVDSAQTYELVMNNSNIILDSNSFLGYIDQNHFGETKWRVRANSTRWKTGYTTWSDTLVFFTSHPPFPPDQILPPYDAQVVADSVTAYVGFEWGPVVRAQLYELEVYYDSALIYSISLPRLTDSVYLDDTGRYEWRIRSGSDHWQMPGQWSDRWPFSVIRP